jgi:ribosome biogenesis GTPase
LLECSALADGDLRALATRLRGLTCVFAGQSGVGKSAILNRLLPEHELPVGELSEKSGEGTHTTSRSTLYHLPGGGEVIDSPGVRAFDLPAANPQTVAACFREFRPYLGQCRFSDCAHLQEPGCVIHQAVTDSAISEDRYQSYRSILGTMLQG